MKKGKIYSILDEEFGGLSSSDDSYDAESAHRRPFYILRHTENLPLAAFLHTKACKKVSHPREKPERRKKYM